MNDLPDIGNRSRTTLFLAAAAAVALLLTPEVLTSSVVPGRATLSPPARRKRAALGFFGLAGSVSDRGKYDVASGSSGATLDAVRMTWPAIKRLVVEANEKAGWEVDVFFHTWDRELEEGLVLLLRPVAYASGPRLLHDLDHTRGLPASIEIALTVLAETLVPNTEPSSQQTDAALSEMYDRILMMRFDALPHRVFELDKLVEADAYYVANWCKALGEPYGEEGAVVAGTPPGIDPALCLPLINFPTQDDEGVPDFWHAGTWSVLWTIYHRMTKDYASGAFRSGKSSPFHGILWGRMQQQGTKVRRYLFHEMDVSLLRRSLQCGAEERTCDPWIHRGTDLSEGSASECDGGRFFCACALRQLACPEFTLV